VKVVIITCYDQVDHPRPRILRKAFADCPGVQTIVIKNKHKGLLRYLEVPCRVLAARITKRPDAYVVTFRGYEMLPFVLCIKGRKPLVFDELVNAIAYLHEHNKVQPGSGADKVFRVFYGWLIRRCRFVLADTQAHGEFSASLSKADPGRFITIPVSADESTFYPRKTKAGPTKGFNVFYYGVMTKLHGLQYMLDAAVILCKKYPDMTFTMGGDAGRSDAAFKAAVKKGARITHRPWFPYEELPGYAQAANVCVGGPFGNTPQSQFVITTKTFQFLAMGLPVLIGRNKVNTIFNHKVNSLVVPQGDTQALVDAISWAYEHPKELTAIGQAGRKLYEQQFSQAIIAKQLQKIVEEL